MSLSGPRSRNYRPAVPLHMEPPVSRASLSPPRILPSTPNLPGRRHSSASCIPRANAPDSSIASSPNIQPSSPVGVVEEETKLLPQSRSAEDLMLYNTSTKMSNPVWHSERHTLPSRAISAPGHLPRQPIINSLLSRIRTISPSNFRQLLTLKSAYNAAFVDEYGTSDPIPYPEAMDQAPKHNPPRRRPTRWICQCFNYVTENCRWGASCKYGHRGDRYLDNPEVVQEFKDGRCITPPKVPKAMREGNHSNKSGADPVEAGEPVMPSGQSVKTHLKKAVRPNRHRENSKTPTIAAESAGGSKADTVNAHEVRAKETESTGDTKHDKENPKHADKQHHESSAKRDTPKLASSAGNSAGRRPKRKSNNHRGSRQGAQTSEVITTAQSQDVELQTEAAVNKDGNKANVSETKLVQTGSSKEPGSVGDKLKKEDANKPRDPTSNTSAAEKELQRPKLSYKTVLVQGVGVPKFPVQTNDKEVASEINRKAVEPQVPVVANSQTTHQDVEKPVQTKEEDTSKTPSVASAMTKWSNEELPSPVETKEPALDSSSLKSLNPGAVEFVPMATEVMHSQPHTGPYSQEPNVTQSIIPQPGRILPELLHPQPRLPIVFGTAPYIEVNRTRIVSPSGRVYLGFIDSYGRPLKMSPEIMDKMTTMPQFIGPPSPPGVVHPFPEPGPSFMRTVAPNDQVNWISTPTPGNGPNIAPTRASPSSEGPPMFQYPVLSRDGRGRDRDGHGHDRHNSHVIGFQSSHKPSGASPPQPQYQTPQIEYASEAQSNGGHMQMQTPPDDQQFNVGGYSYPHLGDAYNCGFEYPGIQGFAPGFQGYHGSSHSWYPQLPVAPIFVPQGMTDGQPDSYFDAEGW